MGYLLTALSRRAVKSSSKSQSCNKMLILRQIVMTNNYKKIYNYKQNYNKQMHKGISINNPVGPHIGKYMRK